MCINSFRVFVEKSRSCIFRKKHLRGRQRSGELSGEQIMLQRLRKGMSVKRGGARIKRSRIKKGGKQYQLDWGEVDLLRHYLEKFEQPLVQTKLLPNEGDKGGGRRIGMWTSLSRPHVFEIEHNFSNL